MSDITLTAHCHCSFASFTYHVPHSALPLKASICHCKSCRYASGQLFATFAVMPSSIARPDFSHLNAYASSAQLTRYSCPKCGAYVGNTEPDEWEFASGMLTSTEGLLDRVQMWIEDTKDGGASIWLKKGHGTNPSRHLRDRKSSEATDSIIDDMSQIAREQASPTTRPSSLKASCHCGAISFALQPPSSPDDQSTPPYKYPAFLDACTACRLTSGFEITSWIRAPQSHLLSPDSQTQQPTSSIHPLTPSNPALNHYYSSSPSVHRYFCKHCTASAFYVNDHRARSVNIAVGLFRAESGARAEEWVSWESGPQFMEDAVDAVFVGGLGEGMRHLPLEGEGGELGSGCDLRGGGPRRWGDDDSSLWHSRVRGLWTK